MARPSHRRTLKPAAAWCFAALACVAVAGASPATALTAQQVNEATFRPGAAKEGIDPAVLRAQVLLDRLRFSPGSIDGREGDNFADALEAFATVNGLPPTRKLTPEIWEKLAATFEGPVLVTYTVKPADVKGPFLEKIPKDYEEMAELKTLGYTSPEEALSEQFHVSPTLLKALNPKVSFEAGEAITVPAVRTGPAPSAGSRSGGESGKVRVARIEIHKGKRALRAYDREGKLLATYPASIGSDEKPAPTGRHQVIAVATNPTYTYNPDFAFKGVKTKKKVEIPAGPNNPVGAVWIDLSAETYGIHGTPDPERVGKSFSHGCVRLTNWDVKDLAGMVGKGTEVEFID